MTFLRSLRHGAAALAAVLLVACADGSNPLEPATSPVFGKASKGETQTTRDVGRQARRELRALRRSFAQGASTDRARITPERGGEVSAGGITLTVPPGAVTEDVVIKMTVPSGGYLFVNFQPHGLVFDKPAKLSFDLSGAEAHDVEDLVGAYVGLESLTGRGPVDILETFPASVDGDDLSFQIPHFSGYIVASGYRGGAFIF